jgi:hypothetical protein
MDGEAIGLRTTNTVEPHDGYGTFCANTKRGFEAVLNTISNIMFVCELDVYERQRIETLVDALERAAQIRRKLAMSKGVAVDHLKQHYQNGSAHLGRAAQRRRDAFLAAWFSQFWPVGRAR